MARRLETFDQKKHGKEFQALLEGMREELLRDMQQRIAANAEKAGDKEIGDVYDAAAQDQGREIELLMSGRDREKLMQIDDALARLRNKTYGICELSEEPIAVKRLRALPFAKYTVEAQREMEELAKLERMRVSDDDERQFQELANSDIPTQDQENLD